MRNERPLLNDPWGRLAEEILRPKKVRQQLSRINRFHHFEAASVLVGMGISALLSAKGHPELATLPFTLSIAAGVSWAETSNDFMRFRFENSKYLQ